MKNPGPGETSHYSTARIYLTSPKAEMQGTQLREPVTQGLNFMPPLGGISMSRELID